ncbi:hypothetical protein GCM10010169_25400 [Micromonospora fulviviridis]|uniref:hypothetical protein n=1 Tax=Micromonospora fulviviridis TaxID=47860 RepID=UPI00166835D5|nr:hypothetical protein [Micromonospora fulviviridis]GGR80144.1 hypothetical protein GCM10010169_25400 [Micromonospora fulviviridis]
MVARERVEFDVVGRDAGGSKAFREVGDAAARAADQIDDAAKASAKAGDQIDDLGDKVKASGDKTQTTSEQYRGLAAEIGQVEGNVRRLAAEIDATGNKELFKDLRKQQGELRKLIRVKDLLPDDSESHEESMRFGGRIAAGLAAGLSRAGGPISAALSNVFGSLPPQAQVAIGAGVVAAGAAAAPALGAVISGAVVGAAGAGGIVGGIAIAAKHPQVQAAAKQTGETFTEALQEAAVSFVPATVESLGVVRSHIDDIGGDLERAFSALSPKMPGLVESAMSGAERAVEGFATAAERAGPVLDAIGTIAEQAGDTVGDVFEKLSEHSSESAHALLTLWGVFDYGIRSLATTVVGLTAAYGWMEKISAFLRGDAAELGRLAAEQALAQQSSNGLADELRKLADGFGDTKVKTIDAVSALETWRGEMDKMTGNNLSARQAQRDLEAAIDDATAAVKENGKTAIDHGAALDINSAKGRANAAALDKIASEANNAYKKIMEQTGSQEMANAAADRGRAQFIALARGMGLSESAANDLANQLLQIRDRKVTVTANTGPAMESARSLVARINNMHARISVKAQGTLSYGGGYHTGEGYSSGMAEGGIVTGPGPKGVDSEWRLLAPGEGVMTSREVDALGGPQGFQQLRAAVRGQAQAPALAAPAGAPGRGVDPLVEEIRGLRRDLSRATLRLDDRTGNYATLLLRGDG